MRHHYPSDISPEQFDPIRALLDSARKKIAPRKVDLYDVFCAVLYLLRTVCQWRALHSDFPKWRTVPASFQIWSTVTVQGGSLKVSGIKRHIAVDSQAQRAAYLQGYVQALGG